MGSMGGCLEGDQVMKVEDICALTIQWIVGKAGQRNKDRDRDRAP